MTTKQLKDFLTDMADEVKQTPVHQRAVAQSRRSAMGRAVFASIAALALLGGGVVGVVSASAEGDRTGQAADPGLPTSDVKKLDGTFYEAEFEQGNGDTLSSWKPGDEKPAEVVAQGTDDGAYYDTGSISPDGEYIAYMTLPPENTSSDNENKIKVRNLQTGKITEVAEYSGMEKTCSGPAWAPDGKRLFVDRGSKFDDRTGFVDVDSGEFTPFAVEHPCDVRVATDKNGEDLVFSTKATSDDIVDVLVTGADGESRTTKVKAVAKEHDLYVREVVAVSPDGRFLCVNTNYVPGDYFTAAGDQFNTCDLIVDDQTGKAIKLEGIDESARTEAEEDETRDVAYGNPSTFAVPGRLIVEKITESPNSDDSNEKQQLYDYEGKLIDEIDSVSSKSDEPVVGFVPK